MAQSCFEMSRAQAYEVLHDLYLRDPDTLNKEICRLNSRFDYLTLKQRFAGCLENDEVEGDGEQDGLLNML